MLAAVVVVCALSAPGAGEAVFAGVAARDPEADAAAERAAVALAQALEKHDVVDLGTPPLPVTVDAHDAILDAAVQAATARYQEGDFQKALEKADDAILRFETKLAFAEKGPWPSYAQALVIKALALKKLGKDADGDAAFTRMAVTMPAAVPDASLAPPKVLERHQQILAQLKGRPRASIEVSSTPPGAEVVVDGEPRGPAPVIVRDLLPGTHFVSLSADGRHIDKKLDVDGNAKVDEKVGDPRIASTKALRQALGAGADESTVLARAKAVADDVIVGVIVPDGARGPALVLARVQGGALYIAATHLDDKAPLKARLAPLVDALVDAVTAPEGTWLPDAADAPAPKALIFGGAAIARDTRDPLDTDPGSDDEGGVSPLFIALGVGAGALAAVAAGTIIAIVVAQQNAHRVEVKVDATTL